MYEATLFDGVNERMHTGRGSTVTQALKVAADKAWTAQNNEPTDTSIADLKECYEVTTTDDEVLRSMKEVPEHTEHLLILVAINRMRMAEGFVQPLER